MNWPLPLSLVTSAALLASAVIYASANDHRSRMCRVVADKIGYEHIRAAGDLTKTRTVVAWGEEEFAFGVSIEECRHSLVPWR